MDVEDVPVDDVFCVSDAEFCCAGACVVCFSAAAICESRPEKASFPAVASPSNAEVNEDRKLVGKLLKAALTLSGLRADIIFLLSFYVTPCARQ